jgi:hypothetical protein
MNTAIIRAVFVIAGLYDGVLGLAFLTLSARIFEFFAVTPPHHPGYIQFPALLLIVFAVMFFRIAAAPEQNRELILYGCGLKIAYCSVTFYHHFTTGIPAMWVPWAWADLVFLAVFAACWNSLSRPSDR